MLCSRSTRTTANPARRSRDYRNGTAAGSGPRATRESWRSSCRNSNAGNASFMEIFRKPLTAAAIKAKARELGADLVGVADGARLDTSHITQLDGGRIIVLAKRLNDGVARIRRWDDRRSEEHTSELQSLTNLVCRLLLEKKKTTTASTR